MYKTIKMRYETIPFSCISLLNSARQINPKIKNKTIKACWEFNASKNKDIYNMPDIALTTSSFIYKSSNKSKYKFFELLP